MFKFFLRLLLALEDCIPQHLRARIPNWLTLFRAVSVAPIIGLYLWGHLDESDISTLCATALFALASVADYLDGWLARRWGVESAAGARWDPIADKALNWPMVAIFMVLGVVPWPFHWVPAAVILIREPAVDLLRRWRDDITFPSSLAAKWKTAWQFISIGLLMLSSLVMMGNYALFVWYVAICTFWIAAGYTLLTGLDYWARVDRRVDRMCASMLIRCRVRSA